MNVSTLITTKSVQYFKCLQTSHQKKSAELLCFYLYFSSCLSNMLAFCDGLQKIRKKVNFCVITMNCFCFFCRQISGSIGVAHQVSLLIAGNNKFAECQERDGGRRIQPEREKSETGDAKNKRKMLHSGPLEGNRKIIKFFCYFLVNTDLGWNKLKR